MKEKTDPRSDPVLTLGEAATIAKVERRLVSRALRAKRDGRPGLGGALFPGAAGWRTTMRAVLEWIEGGTPGTEEVDEGLPDGDDDT